MSREGVTIGILCPDCGSGNVRVIDSRPHELGHRWRRYECRACEQRFSTQERVLGGSVKVESGAPESPARSA